MGQTDIAKLQIEIESSQAKTAVTGLDQVTAAGERSERATDRLRKASEDLASEHDRLGSAGQSLSHILEDELTHSFLTAQAQFELLQRSFESMVEFVGEGIEKALEAERADLKLANAMRTVGIESKAMEEALHDLAEGFQDTAGVQVDAVKGIETMLIQMGTAPRDIAKVTQAVLDFSAATGSDAQSAALLFGKAADGNLAVLKRYGIEVEKTGNDHIDLLNTLDAVEKKFGGSAKASLEGYTGTVTKLGLAWDKLKESIGHSLLDSQIMSDLNALADLGKTSKTTEDAASRLKALDKGSSIIEAPAVNLDLDAYHKGVVADAQHEKEVQDALLKAHQDSLDELLKQTERAEKEEGRIERESIERTQTDWNKAEAKRVEADRKANEEIARAREALAQDILSVTSSMEDAFVEFATTGKTSFTDMVNSMLKDLEKLLVHKAFEQAVSLGLDLLFPTGGHAGGGVATSGQPIIVGESGPELFVPSGNGSIVPNGAMQGGGTQVSIAVTVNADGSSNVTAQSSSQRSDALRFGRQLGDAIRKTLNEEMEPGGSLYTFRGSA